MVLPPTNGKTYDTNVFLNISIRFFNTVCVIVPCRNVNKENIHCIHVNAI